MTMQPVSEISDEEARLFRKSRASRLAQHLRTLRWRKGWDMARLAAAAGISRTTLPLVERGPRTHARASTLDNPARVRDVAVAHFRAVSISRGPAGGTA